MPDNGPALKQAEKGYQSIISGSQQDPLVGSPVEQLQELKNLEATETEANVDETDKVMSIDSSAWLSRYGALPSAPSNRFSVLAFDDYIYIASGTSTTDRSYPVLNGLLGMFDQMAIQVITDHVTVPPGSGASVSLTAQIAHSADGRWFPLKNANPEVSQPPTLSQQGVTAMEPGYDPGSVATLGYARLEITLTTTAARGTTSARVKVYVTCNDYREKNFSTLLRHRRELWRKAFNPVIHAHLLALEGKNPFPDGSSSSC